MNDEPIIAFISGHAKLNINRLFRGGAGGDPKAAGVPLRDLRAVFVHKRVHHWGPDKVLDREGIGMEFDCPDGCGARYAILLANPGDGGPPLYEAFTHYTRTGTTLDDLGLLEPLPSISPCGWHGTMVKGHLRRAPCQ